MPALAKLLISNLRNIQEAELGLAPGFNAFFGTNGSGKTSVLEAAYLLALGRSFRSHAQKPVVREGMDEAVVSGVTREELRLGIKRPIRGAQTIHIAGRKAEGLAELSKVLPVLLLNTETLLILEGSSQERRRFLDWGVFHVEHSFLTHWRRAKLALQNRNILLRQAAPEADLEPWTHELIRSAQYMDQYRQRYLSRFQPHFKRSLDALLSRELAERLVLDYRKGWSDEGDLADQMARSLGRDLRQGHTALGPHRAELSLRIGSYDAADVLSRGQLKMLVCALKLAQAELLQTERNLHSIFLVDDLPAELDAENRMKVCQELARLGVQVMLTAIERSALDAALDSAASPPGGGCKLFHVKHGTITDV